MIATGSRRETWPVSRSMTHPSDQKLIKRKLNLQSVQLVQKCRVIVESQALSS